MLKNKLFAGAWIAAALTLGSGLATAEPVEIRIQWSVTPPHLTPLIPHAPEGVYRHWGKSYVVKPIRMRGSGPALQAVAAGEIEFGGMSAQALTLGVKRARLDLRVIAQVMSGGVEGYATSEYHVRKGGVTTIQGLKGKTLAVNALGGTVDAGIRAHLGRAGLKAGRDFQLVEVRFSAMLPALTSKKIDLALLVTPFNLIAHRKGETKTLFTMRDALGPTETLQWIGKADFIKKNRAALVDFLEDNMRFRRWLYNPANRQAAAEIISKVTKRPAKNYASWVFTNKDNYRDPNAMTNIPRLQRNIEDLHKLGVLPMTLDAKKYVDMSLAQEAAKRLKGM